MKNTLHISIFSLIFLTACIKPDPKPEYFTWEGTLYKGMNDEPLANTELYLHSVTKPSLSYSVKQTTLASTTTDANGRFKITYPRIDQKFEAWRNNEEGLYLEKGPLSSITTNYIVTKYPWNINIKKDFAETNHSRVLVDVTINSDTLPDSLYYSFESLVENSNTRQFYFQNHNTWYPVFVVPITSRKMVFSNKSRWGAIDFKNSPGPTFYCPYGISEEDLNLATSNEPGIPSSYNTISYTFRGFPKIDTIKIVIP